MANIEFGNYDYQEENKQDTPIKLKKFLVYIRRSEVSGEYNGEYGFDWLRDEYIYPLTNFENKVVCFDVEDIKAYYKNGLSPYGKDYYYTWLTLMPKQEIKLNVQIEGLETLVEDETKIIFEPSENITITPNVLPLKSFVLGGKNTKIIFKDYYLDSINGVVTIQSGSLKKDGEIKIFAQLENEKIEVGNLIVLKNDEALELPVRFIKILAKDDPKNYNGRIFQDFSDSKFTKIKGDLKSHGLNQALINVVFEKETASEVKVIKIDIDDLKKKGLIENGDSQPKLIEKKETELKFFFAEEHMKEFGNFNGILIFLTMLHSSGFDAGFSNESPRGYNSVCITDIGIESDNNVTYIHEIGHALGLEHTFSTKEAQQKDLEKTKNMISILQGNVIKDNEYIGQLHSALNSAKTYQPSQMISYSENGLKQKTTANIYRKKINKHIESANEQKKENKKNLEDQKTYYADSLEIDRMNKFHFIQGTTDNIMDYNGGSKKGTTNPNKAISFFKYQNEIMQETITKMIKK